MRNQARRREQIKHAVPIVVVLNAGIDNVEKAAARLKCRVIKVRPKTEQANQVAARWSRDKGVGAHPATLSADAHAIERGGAEANANAAAANSCKAKKAARMRRNAGGNAEAVLFIPSPIARHGRGEPPAVPLHY